MRFAHRARERRWEDYGSRGGNRLVAKCQEAGRPDTEHIYDGINKRETWGAGAKANTKESTDRKRSIS